jgi:MFS family permease
MQTELLQMQSEDAIYRKVTRRLMPFLFLCYVLAYVDRVNVGFAKLQMQQDLGMSDSVYGFGAGVFFIGYFFFEVPANLILQRIGARLWLGPIMMLWGAVSACTLFVKGAASFYAARFLRGIVESGFFPGVILYMTYWYTGRQRARMVAMFMSAVPVSSVLAGPISGWILDRMSGIGTLAAWQWLFIIEGVPSSQTRK